MLLKVPFEATSQIFKHKNIPLILETLRRRRFVRTGTVMSYAKISRRIAQSSLSSLTKAEFVVREKGGYRITERIGDNFIVLNLRDARTDCLFRWRSARRLLYLLYTRPDEPLSHLASKAAVSYRMTKKIVRSLRSAGIIHGRDINRDLIIEPEDPVSLIPQSSHQQVIRHFLYALKTIHRDFDDAIILFGNASWGATYA